MGSKKAKMMLMLYRDGPYVEPRYLSVMVLGHKNHFKSSLRFESNKIQWILF